ncbi:hypothetical protein [Thauera butanivorans]|uniref:hypothetical protein n=1 Tax=Thauera butanivorans TaxID=86174 RepID=UPI000838558E|nr:hypothetical protein [Thauera butanivorans]
MNWLTDLTNWLFELVKKAIDAIWDFLQDAFIAVADVVLGIVASAIEAIPVPSFVTQYSLGNLLSQMHPDILFFVGILQIPTGLSFLAAGFGVRMIRKAVTLFQW